MSIVSDFLPTDLGSACIEASILPVGVCGACIGAADFAVDGCPREG